MKTLFYNRTGYSVYDIPVPKCFIELDEYFGKLFPTTFAIFHPSVRLAENLCHRMADVEVYARYVTEEEKGENAMESSILIGTLLVGFFTSCKSVLDAGAIALDTIYNLELSERDQDFGKPKLLPKLKQITGPVIYDRYTAFKSLIKEIIDWRDSAVHRHTPFVIVHSRKRPDKVPREEQEIKLANRLDADFYIIEKMKGSVDWTEPLHYYKKWEGQLIDFCKEVCLDIRGQTLGFTPSSS